MKRNKHRVATMIYHPDSKRSFLLFVAKKWARITNVDAGVLDKRKKKRRGRCRITERREFAPSQPMPNTTNKVEQ
jgi:hypothetical protein